MSTRIIPFATGRITSTGSYLRVLRDDEGRPTEETIRLDIEEGRKRPVKRYEPTGNEAA